MLHAQEHAEHVGVEGGGVARRGLLDDRTGRAFGAGIIDGDIEAAEPGDRPVDQVLHLVLVAHVGADEFRFGAECPQFGDQSQARVLATPGNDKPGTFVREGEGGGAADAGQRAGDEDNGVTHMSSPWLRIDLLASPRVPTGYRSGTWGVAHEPRDTDSADRDWSRDKDELRVGDVLLQDEGIDRVLITSEEPFTTSAGCLIVFRYP